MAGGDCGGIGRQETLHAMPTGAGSCTIQVFPSEDSVNMGKGGSFFVDISTGPLASVASNPGVHVGDLDATSSSTKSGWKATITITVHNSGEGMASGAMVSGVWSGGFSGDSYCITNGSGQCSLSSGTMSKRNGSATFTVSNIAAGALPYQPAGNHDPDPGNDGTSITASKP